MSPAWIPQGSPGRGWVRLGRGQRLRESAQRRQALGSQNVLSVSLALGQHPGLMTHPVNT